MWVGGLRDLGLSPGTWRLRAAAPGQSTFVSQSLHTPRLCYLLVLPLSVILSFLLRSELLPHVYPFFLLFCPADTCVLSKDLCGLWVLSPSPPPPFYTLPRCLWAFSCSPFLSLSLTLPPFLPLDFSSPGGPKAKVWVALASSLRAGGWGQQRGEGSEKVA